MTVRPLAVACLLVFAVAVLSAGPEDVVAASRKKRPPASPLDRPGNQAPQKTVITGERMNLLQKGAAVEFVGGVKLVRGDDLLRADRLVSDEKSGLTQAWGRVYLRRDDPVQGARWEAWGDEGVYDTNDSSGTLRGAGSPARLVRTPVGAKGVATVLTLESDRITLFRSSATAASTGTATSADTEGRVYVRYVESAPEERETEIWAGRAALDGAAGSARFTGAHPSPPEPAPAGEAWEEVPAGPLARQAEGGEVRRLAGDTMIYFLDERRLVVEDNVRAILLTPDPGGAAKGKRGAPR